MDDAIRDPGELWVMIQSTGRGGCGVAVGGVEGGGGGGVDGMCNWTRQEGGKRNVWRASE